VRVSGGSDPADEYQSLFIIEFRPKGIVFPENFYGQVFQMGEVADSVPELRKFLAGGFDWFLGEQAWVHFDEEEIEKFVMPLPPPFNDPDVQAHLVWGNEDVVFDRAAQILLGFYDTAYAESVLQGLKVGELQIVLAAKARGENFRSVNCSRKADLIEAILEDQRRKGLSAVRVIQKTLEVLA
jgi:hypothetical protein